MSIRLRKAPHLWEQGHSFRCAQTAIILQTNDLGPADTNKKSKSEDLDFWLPLLDLNQRPAD